MKTPTVPDIAILRKDPEQVRSVMNSTKNNGTDKHNSLLEEYKNTLFKGYEISESLTALKEILHNPKTDIDLTLSEAGRNGLAHIIGHLAAESMSAWGELPSPLDFHEMLEEARS